MKLPFITTIRSLVLLLAIVPLLSSECDGKIDNVGYHYIPIPNFDESDYLQMLKSKNEEIQYNAICYFSDNYKYEKTLDTDSLKGTDKYKTALQVYNEIYPMISSKNDWVSSAAIRFINSFKYNRAKFLDIIAVNNKPSRNVQLEIIYSLQNDTIADKDRLFEKYRFLRSQPSWLLQNSAYQIRILLSNEHINQLMNDYRKSQADYEKFLIIDALSGNITDPVFDFLTSEWSTTKNEHLKNQLEFILPAAKNQQKVLQWFNKNDSALQKILTEVIFGLDYGKNNIFMNLLLLAFDKGLKPYNLRFENDDEGYFGESILLIHHLHEKFDYNNNKTKDSISVINYNKVEAEIFKDPVAKKNWLAIMDKYSEFPLPKDLIDRHQLLTKEYLNKTRSLFEQYGIDSSIYADYIKSIGISAQELLQKTVRKK
jgi:hypothetical protein